MANHVRRQLRDAVTTALTGLTTTGTRVYGYRVYALDQASELPALAVYITDESAESITVHAPGQVERQPTVHVRGYAAAGNDLDDTLDLIAKEVETALGTALTVSAKGVLLEYIGCEIEFEATDRPVGAIDMRFTTRLFNTANAPDVLL